MPKPPPTYDLDKIDKIASALDALAEQGPRVLSAKLAVERLMPKIMVMIGKGWGFDGIATELRGLGLTVTAKTVSEVYRDVIARESSSDAPAKPRRGRPAKTAKSVPLNAAPTAPISAPSLTPATKRSRSDV